MYAAAGGPARSLGRTTGPGVSSTKPRLAYVVGSLSPGGTERLVLDMSRALVGSFDVFVFCLDEPGTWARDARQSGITVHCLWRQRGLDLAVALRLARAFRRLGIDIVHAHQYTPWFYAALSRMLNPSTKLLFQEHGRFYPEIEKPLRRIVNRMLIERLTDRIVAVSRDIRDRLVRYEGLDSAGIDVIYNGVHDVPELPAGERRRIRTEAGFTEFDFVVGSVGRLDPIKNLPMFVDALVAASGSDSRLQGWIIGDGPEFGEISMRIQERGASDRIRMAGYRVDVNRYLQCLDLFVLCSFSEGTSMALLEAMSAGIPVIVTEVGGNAEIVENGISGWVIPSGSVDLLTEHLQVAVASPDFAQSAGRAGRKRVTEMFTFDRMIESFRAIYAAMLQPRASVRRKAVTSEFR